MSLQSGLCVLIILSSTARTLSLITPNRIDSATTTRAFRVPSKLKMGVVDGFESKAPVSALSSTNTNSDETAIVVDTSTLTLLEHINLNVPNHDYIVPFYVHILGLGLDPRKAGNLLNNKGTVWTNCGASQFHLPYGDSPQVIPGSIGLRYATLEPMLQRLKDQDDAWQNGAVERSFKSYEYHDESASSSPMRRRFIRLQDWYGNIFYCRESPELGRGRHRLRPQPLVSTIEEKDVDTFGAFATLYGMEESECRGIEYVEFKCPVGIADKIALFYDSVFDATTSIVQDDDSKVAVIGFGTVDANGKAEQCLLFRETSESIPPYDGHHIALYVGQSGADFEQAFKNCETAGIVWVNPRFSDKADDLQGAKEWHQFRFKDIIDMDSGQPIFELEHEVRSLTHSAWPGYEA